MAANLCTRLTQNTSYLQTFTIGKSQPDCESIVSKMVNVTLNTSSIMDIRQFNQEATPELALLSPHESPKSAEPNPPCMPTMDNNLQASFAIGKKSTPLATFTCFPALPTELRLAIWALSCQIPRNVDVWVRSARNITFPHDDAVKKARAERSLKIPTPYGRKLVYKSHAGTIPPILHTSSESRLVALEHYSPLGSSHKEDISLDSHDSDYGEYIIPPELYFNSATDVLVVPTYKRPGPPMVMKHVLHNQGHTIRKVAIEPGEFFSEVFFGGSLTPFNIEEVFIYWTPESHKSLMQGFDDDSPVDFELLPIDDPAIDLKYRDDARRFLESFERLFVSFFNQTNSMSQRSGRPYPKQPIFKQMVLLVKPRGELAV